MYGNLNISCSICQDSLSYNFILFNLYFLNQLINTCKGNILTATSSLLNWAFHTAPNLPLAFISNNWMGLVSKNGEGGGIGFGSEVGNWKPEKYDVLIC